MEKEQDGTGQGIDERVAPDSIVEPDPGETLPVEPAPTPSED